MELVYAYAFRSRRQIVKKVVRCIALGALVSLVGLSASFGQSVSAAVEGELAEILSVNDITASLQERADEAAVQCRILTETCSAELAELKALRDADLDVSNVGIPTTSFSSPTTQQSADTVRPTVDTVSISPSVLNVGAGQTRIAVSYSVSDDNSGLGVILVRLQRPGAPTINGDVDRFNAEMSASGILNIDVSDGIAAGEYDVEIALQDEAGNYSCSGVYCKVGTVEVVNPAEDTVRPTVDTVSISPSVLNVGAGQTRIAVSYSVSDDNSGLGVILVRLQRPGAPTINGDVDRFNAEMSASGILNIDVSDGIAAGEYDVEIALQDEAGNYSCSGVYCKVGTVLIRNGNVAISLSSSSSDPINGPFDFNLVTSRAVSGFETSDIQTENVASRSVSCAGSSAEPVTCTGSMQPLSDGEVRVFVPAGAMTDLAGAPNDASNILVFQYDGTKPIASIASSNSTPVSGAFAITVSFTESVTGFEASDLKVGNGSASAFAGTGDTYTAEITPSGDGPVTVDIADGVAQDAAGNDNTAAEQFSIEADASAPSVSIATQSANPVSGAFSIDILFTKPVTGFEVGDLIVRNGNASNFTGSGSSYTAYITPITDGTVTIDVTAGVAQDAAGNENTAAEQFAIEADSSAPDVSIASTDEAPVGGSFQVTITFTEPVFGFEANDLTIGNGKVDGLSGSGATYIADITPSADGTITVDVVAGIAQDAAGNDNTAATQFSIESDRTAPSVSIATTSAGPVSGAFSITVTFTEAVTGFVVGDITVGNGSASSLAGSGTTYTADITPTADGTVTVDVAAGVAQDNAGNHNTAATQLFIESDGTAPTVTIISTSSDPVSGTFSVTATFSEAVSGFVVGDLSVGNGSASNLQTADNSVFTADITPSADGTLTVDVAAGAAQDVAGNDNTAASQFSVEYDGTRPGVSIAFGPGAPVEGPPLFVRGPFNVEFRFDEAVEDFTISDIVVGNGVADDFGIISTNAAPAQISGDGTQLASIYTAIITPAADGIVTVDVAAGAAQDAAGNDNTAATQFSIESDGTPPSLSITSDAATVSGPFTATFTFSEAVTGFELGDIVVANGAVSEFGGAIDVYTATITPETVGALTISVAEGASDDAAGNASGAGDFVVTVRADAPSVDIVISSTDADPGSVAASARITNPGSTSLEFTANADVLWLNVDPTSGSIPSLGDLDLVVTLNDSVDELEPGDYTGTVTVLIDGGSAPAGFFRQSTGSTILAEVPIALQVEERFGTVELVATAPDGASGDASFGYTSDLEDFDGLTLTTANGRASAISGDVLFGSYAIAQSAPAGWRVEAVSCSGDTDGGSTFDPATGHATLDIDPGEALVCTFQNVRDEDVVRIATQRAIRNFMARRADRIVAAAPDFSQRFSQRDSIQRGAFAAGVDGSGRSTVVFSASLSGMRNAAEAATPQIAGATNYKRPFAENWDVWLAAEFASVSDNRAGDDARSDFAVTQLGIDYQVSDTLILGVMAQYDWMDEVTNESNIAAGAIAGVQVEGNGWMAGPYGVWKLRDTLTFDALAMYGTSDNTVNPLGLYEDAFETDRFLLRANLTGEFGTDNWRIRPQANLTHFEETQRAYTDSLYIAIPEQTVTLGRITAGPEVVWMERRTDGSYLELSSSLRAVWDYQAADLLNEAGLLIDGDNEMRADARVGIRAGLASGLSFRFEAGFSGLGIGDFEATSARFQLRIPFGTGGRWVDGASLSRAASTMGLRQRCDDPAGQGFANAAGLIDRCGSQDLDRFMH